MPATRTHEQRPSNTVPFADPTPTQADINFRLFGFPVRVHPFFWLVAVLLAPIKDPKYVVIWIPAMLVSILVHEFGHAFLQRRYGGYPRIVLYGFGGLASAEGVRITPWRQIAISLAGPIAGFLLAAVVWGVDSSIPPPSKMLNFLLQALLWINIVWGIFNLLPIYPLDGGQVSRELFTMVLRPDRGIIVSLWVSIVFCAIAAGFLWLRTHSLFNLVLMGALAFNNYQTLEAYRNARRGDW